ncbi:9439_t:CDS:2 [Rhizophagus irregularis]|nr:9439_t:CDS:2 [Rhizophagus irregularis]
MDFLNEVKNYIHCMESNRTNFRTCSLIRFYGISYDPITQDFIIVAEYANKGNLKQNIMKPAELAYCVVYDVNLSSNENTYSLLKTMNLTGNNPGTCYTSRFLSFQRVKEHLAKLTLEDSGQNDLSLPTSINDDNIKDFEDKIIALPTLSNTSPSQIP